MSNDQVKTLGGIVTNGGGGIINHEHAFGIDELEVLCAHFFLNADKGIVHGLTERQVSGGAGHHDCDAEGFSHGGFGGGWGFNSRSFSGGRSFGSGGFSGRRFGSGCATGAQNESQGKYKPNDFFHLLLLKYGWICFFRQDNSSRFEIQVDMFSRYTTSFSWTNRPARRVSSKLTGRELSILWQPTPKS